MRILSGWEVCRTHELGSEGRCNILKGDKTIFQGNQRKVKCPGASEEKGISYANKGWITFVGSDFMNEICKPPHCLKCQR